MLDPIAITLGTITVRWYGLMYLLSFVLGYYYLRVVSSFSRDELLDLIFYVAVGVILGGRVGYILIYTPELLLNDYFSWIKFWLPGRSFHAGLIGVLIALWLYARKYKVTFLKVIDTVALATPIGLGAGRIGNFINGELWGRPTDVAWGIIYPYVDKQTRHPSQIYEFILEGVVLFVVLFLLRKRLKKGQISGLFAILYSIFRFSIEFFREPDFDLVFNPNLWDNCYHYHCY